MKLILNLIMLAVILLCVWNGYKKGLVLGIGGLLVIVISLYAADLLSDTYAYEINDALRPFASGYLETKTSSSRKEPTEGVPSSVTERIFAGSGIVTSPSSEGLTAVLLSPIVRSPNSTMYPLGLYPLGKPSRS